MGSWNYIFGDSIAAGLAVSQGLSRKTGASKTSSKDDKGQSRVGAKPDEILKYLEGFGAAKFDGKVVILSTGYTNATGNLTKAKETIKKQLQFLKDANAAVLVVGVCGAKKDINGNALKKDVLKMDIAAGNDWLKEVAVSYLQEFAGGFFKTSDGLHPSDYALYWNTFSVKIPLAPVAKSSDPPAADESVASAVEPPPTEQTSVAGQVESVPDPPKVQTANPLSVHGKIILKKVSGPGEIIGEVEKSLSLIDMNRGVSFEGISFSEAGDYEVSVTSDNPDIEPFTFKVKINKEPEFVPQDAKAEDKPEVKGTKPCIAQVSKPSLVLPPMSLPGLNDTSLNQEVINSVGLHPFVQFAGVTIQHTEIGVLKLFHNGIMPMCNMTFDDTSGLLRTNPALDNSTFQVFIDSKSPDLKYIHLAFKVQSFKQVGEKSYAMSGMLHVPEGDYLYLQNYDSYSGTSLEVLSGICKRVGLGFNTNIDRTDDAMNWVNCGLKTHEVIKDIVEHSYAGEKSFMWAYIDYYYCFNYIDIEKEMTRDVSQDIGVETAGTKAGEAKFVDMKLVNEPSVSSSCFYFDSFDLKNNSTRTSLDKGYRTQVKYYDVNTKKMLVFDVDGNTSDQATNLILKGSSYDTKWYDANIRTEFKGNIDTTNVHKNYHYAPVLNKRNLDDLQKITMTINLPHMNLSIYKGQKIRTEVINQAPNPPEPEYLIHRLCGEWVVSDIVYLYQGGAFTQKVILVRRELGKTPDEAVTPVAPKAEKQPDEKTVNPEPIKFNEGYEIGETYAFNGQDGFMYFVVVKSKSDDGKNISGTVKRRTGGDVYPDENYDLLDPEYLETQAQIVIEEIAPPGLVDPPASSNNVEDNGSNLVNSTVAGGDVVLPKGKNGYSHNSTQGYNLVDSKWYGSLVKSARAHIDHPTFDIPDTGNGNLGCASWVSMVFYRAFGVHMRDGKPVKAVPKSIGDFGSKGTADIGNFVKSNPSFWDKIPWKEGKPGDLIVTEKATKYGHVGVVIDELASDGTYAIASNSSSIGRGQKNLSIKSWQGIANRNPNGTFCWRYKGPMLAMGQTA